MARLFSKGSRKNRRLLQLRRPYIVLAVAGVVIVAVVLHRTYSASPQPTVSKGGSPEEVVNPEATALNATQKIRKLTTNPGRTPATNESPSGVVTLAAPQMIVTPNPAVDTTISQARELSSQPGQIVAARDKLNSALAMSMTSAQGQATKEQLAQLADKWLFSSIVLPGDTLCEMYTARSGDSLEAIGRRFKVPYETLMHINRIQDPRALQAGQRIKVIHGPFHVKIYRSTFTLDLYVQDMFVRSFRVALGAPGNDTPTGLWRVQESGKMVQPPWFDKRTNRNYVRTDPDYPLGARWIGLDGVDGAAKGRTGFAIHGTKDPDRIGTAVSQGCIRMHDEDVIALYDLMQPVSSKVEVVD
jgi:LysM repeat protein